MRSGRRLFSPLVVLLFSLAVSGNAFAFRSVSTESFTDPDYKSYAPKKVVIIVTNATNDARKIIEERLIGELAGHGVLGVKERDLFPPTREWTPDARRQVASENGVDSSLVVAVGASSASIRTVGRQTFGTTNVSGTVNANSTLSGPNAVRTDGTFRGTASTNTTSYDMVSARSSADFSAVLVDLSTSRTVWYADVTTKASGTLFVGGKGDAKASVKGVVDALVKDGHLKKK